MSHTELLNPVHFFKVHMAFDKVWHKGLIFKLNPTVICDALLDLIECFLENRFQRVVLNGQTSQQLPVKAGVP